MRKPQIHNAMELARRGVVAYGWGIAKYAVTEDVLGAEVTQGAYHRDPEESRERILRHLSELCPDAFDEDLAKLIR